MRKIFGYADAGGGHVLASRPSVQIGMSGGGRGRGTCTWWAGKGRGKPGSEEYLIPDTRLTAGKGASYVYYNTYNV